MYATGLCVSELLLAIKTLAEADTASPFSDLNVANLMAYSSTLFAGLRMSTIASLSSSQVGPGRNSNRPGRDSKLVILDILMPANSVEGCAIKLAALKSEKGETVSASALILLL